MTAVRLTVIQGCMFSGKTERLIEHLRMAQQAGRPVAAFKHASDKRYAAGPIVAHNGTRVDATPVTNASEILQQVLQQIGAAELVAIDEAQFFDEHLVSVCRSLLDGGHELVLAGLDLDSWGRPFGPMPALAELADDVIQTFGRCARCGRPADRTQRLTPAEPATMIGGSDSYEPRCKNCFQPPPIDLRC